MDKIPDFTDELNVATLDDTIVSILKIQRDQAQVLKTLVENQNVDLKVFSDAVKQLAEHITHIYALIGKQPPNAFRGIVN